MRFLLTETTEVPSLDGSYVSPISNSFDSFLKLVVTLLVFVFVLVITYLCTKWMGNYQRLKLRSGNLQILESLPAGNNKMICLVKAGTEYLVVGVGSDEIRLLTTLKEEQLTDLNFNQKNDGSTGVTDSFSDILSKLTEKLPKK